MPKVGYSQQERARIRRALVDTALTLMAKQGIRHTTVEQIYKSVGISRSFFYSFFSTKEDLIVETFYLQQPRILAYARSLMEDPALSWREGVRQFLQACCWGERSGIAVMTIEEQQQLFTRLSEESMQTFRFRQRQLFGRLLECFGIRANDDRINLFTNISLTAMIVRRAIPETLPFFVPQAAQATVDFQIEAILDALEKMAEQPASG